MTLRPCMVSLMIKYFFLLILLVSSDAFAIIYGQDTRQFIRSSSGTTGMPLAARSVGILIADTDVEDSKTVPGLKDFYTDTLEKNQYLCSKERFAKQQSFFVACTGFLVAPDILVTAGHCAVNFGEVRNTPTPLCTDFSWYFDFEVDGAGKAKTTEINPDNLYECETVLHAAHTTKMIGHKLYDFSYDFAVLKLKKPVRNAAPLKITGERPKPGERASMIGHPLGGPKIATSGIILSNEPMFDRATVGGFPGNSGSPVFNKRGEVFGILVRGAESLVDIPGQVCREVNRCSAQATNCTLPDLPGYPSGDHLMPLSLIEELKRLQLLK